MKCICVKIQLNRKLSLLLNIWCRSFVLLVWFSRKQILWTVFRKLIRECSCSHPLLKGRGRKGRPGWAERQVSFLWADRQAWNCNVAHISQLWEQAVLGGHFLSDYKVAIEGREPWGGWIHSVEGSGRSSRVCCRQQKRQSFPAWAIPPALYTCFSVLILKETIPVFRWLLSWEPHGLPSTTGLRPQWCHYCLLPTIQDSPPFCLD